MVAPVGPSWLKRAKCHLSLPAGSLQRGFPIQVPLTVADEASASQAAKEDLCPRASGESEEFMIVMHSEAPVCYTPL